MEDKKENEKYNDPSRVLVLVVKDYDRQPAKENMVIKKNFSKS